MVIGSSEMKSTYVSSITDELLHKHFISSSSNLVKFRHIKFDTFTPAVERGLPVTRVISRMKLQQILARAVGDGVILNGSNVIDFVDDGTRFKT